MLRGSVGLKKWASVLPGGRAVSWLLLCAALFMLNGSALALVQPQPTLASIAVQQTVREVTVTVRPTGCEPESATQAAGQIKLVVVNQTGGADLTVRFYDGRGNLLREVVIGQGANSWDETFDLRAGSYTVVAGPNQEWTFHLTIQ